MTIDVEKKVMKLFRFDFQHGRVDTTMHPCCFDVPSDVRIAIRPDPKNLSAMLFDIIHEVGHAMYNQNLPSHLHGSAIGDYRSLGVHESQSLFFEMQLGRSKTFIDLLSEKLDISVITIHPF